MWPEQVSNPGPLTYEPGALMTSLRDPGYKTFFILNSVKHEILNAHKYKISRNSAF